MPEDEGVQEIWNESSEQSCLQEKNLAPDCNILDYPKGKQLNFAFQNYEVTIFNKKLQ